MENLTIYIKPHIKKFVLIELHGEPVECTQSNLAGQELLNLLTKKSEGKGCTEGLDTLDIMLSGDLFVHRRRISKAAKSGRVYENFFKIALTNFVRGAAPFLGSRKAAIYTFCEWYGIEEEEFRYETAERMFHGRAGQITTPRKVYKNGLVRDLLNRLQQKQDTIEMLNKRITELTSFNYSKELL